MIPGSTAHVEIVNAIRLDHLRTAQKLIQDKNILGRVEREIEFDCKRLEDFLNAAQVCCDTSGWGLTADHQRN